jgi:hypothetical protein
LEALESKPLDLEALESKPLDLDDLPYLQQNTVHPNFFAFHHDPNSPNLLDPLRT